MKKERKRGLFEQKNECTGLLFRCSISSFPMMDGKRRYFQSSIRMSFLKRKSCGGCEHCGWMLDFMSEQFYNDLAMNPREYNDGWIYALVVTESSVDECELGFVPYEDCRGRRLELCI